MLSWEKPLTMRGKIASRYNSRAKIACPKMNGSMAHAVHGMVHHPLHTMVHRARGTHLRAEKEEEVGADLDRSAGRFRRVHQGVRGNAAAPVRCRPVALVHYQDRPHLPPDRPGIDTRIIDDMAVIRRGHKDIASRRASLPERG